MVAIAVELLLEDCFRCTDNAASAHLFHWGNSAKGGFLLVGELVFSPTESEGFTGRTQNSVWVHTKGVSTLQWNGTTAACGTAELALPGIARYTEQWSRGSAGWPPAYGPWSWQAGTQCGYSALLRELA